MGSVRIKLYLDEQELSAFDLWYVCLSFVCLFVRLFIFLLICYCSFLDCMFVFVCLFLFVFHVNLYFCS